MVGVRRGRRGKGEIRGVFKAKRDYVNKTRTVHFSEEL
jgi:hypothetical protein